MASPPVVWTRVELCGQFPIGVDKGGSCVASPPVVWTNVELCGQSPSGVDKD